MPIVIVLHAADHAAAELLQGRESPVGCAKPGGALDAVSASLKGVELGVGTVVWIERRKWKDDPHYGSEGIYLGEDDHGRWVGANAGNRMYKGAGEIRPGRYPIVWCVPRDGWFLAHYLEGHPEIDIYIDIAAPAAWSERGAKLVDLDFDVVVWNDGRPVELVDEDEFEEHRLALRYPEDITAAARSAASKVFETASTGAAPFNFGVARPWFAVLESLPC